MLGGSWWDGLQAHEATWWLALAGLGEGDQGLASRHCRLPGGLQGPSPLSCLIVVPTQPGEASSTAACGQLLNQRSEGQGEVEGAGRLQRLCALSRGEGAGRGVGVPKSAQAVQPPAHPQPAPLGAGTIVFQSISSGLVTDLGAKNPKQPYKSH